MTEEQFDRIKSALTETEKETVNKITYLKHLERACFDLQDREVIGTLDDLYWMLSAMEALADYAADKYSSCEVTFLQLSCLIRLASSSVTTLLCKLDK